MIMRGILLAATALVATQARAGDAPKYAPAPDWVKHAPLPDLAKGAQASPLLIMDQQQRLQDGEVWIYFDSATLMASAQMLAQGGTVAIPWAPEQGDLIVHRAQIIRGAETVDLLAGSERFTVLRREEELEQLRLSGLLTATMNVKGLRVGDVLRVTASITRKDTTLAGNMQTVLPLLPQEARPQFARARLMWPKSQPVKWKTFQNGIEPAISADGDFNVVEIPVPLGKQPDMPGDAPVRFHKPPIMEVSTFEDWAAVSRTMAPLYNTAGTIADGSPLAAQVSGIMTKHADPRARAAAALHIVQEEVRYLFKGMDGGHYVPQTPADTWTLRYGDCKAKTLLLLAMLHKMGITAEPVVVHSALGDVIPERLPSAAAFDHVIVRAEIGGESLWLDGTRSGARLADIADTPNFRHVLPLRAGGASLTPLPVRPSVRPDIATVIELDQRAGADFPAPFRISMAFRGDVGQALQQIALQGSPEQIDQLLSKSVSDFVANSTVFDEKIIYDAETGLATMSASGVTYPNWKKNGAQKRLAIEYILPKAEFAPDRTRTAWRAIPVATGNPSHMTITTRTQVAEGTRLDGKADYSATLAGIDVSRRAAIANGVLTLEERQLGSGAEIAATGIGAARDAVARAKSQWIYAVVDDGAPYWRRVEQGRKAKRFDTILAAYARDIADAPDKSQPLFNRAWFKGEIYDREGAIADLTRAIAIEADTDYYFARANHYRALGQEDKALADLQAAYEADSGSFDAIQALASLQADRGGGDAALELVDPRVSASDEEGRNFLALKANLLARNGSVEEAIAAIDSAIAASPRDASLLNTRCWIKGTMNVSLDTALADCTRSIELGESPAAALDSRALVHFRMKRYDEALTDLNAALDIAPNMAAGLYLRGVVHQAKGDAVAAKDDLAAARQIWPPIDQDYKRWSIAP